VLLFATVFLNIIIFDTENEHVLKLQPISSRFRAAKQHSATLLFSVKTALISFVYIDISRSLTFITFDFAITREQNATTTTSTMSSTGTVSKFSRTVTRATYNITRFAAFGAFNFFFHFNCFI
jgi:hypothetical protein